MTVRFYKAGKFLIGYVFVVSIIIDPFGNVTLKHITKEGLEDIKSVDFHTYDELRFMLK